MSMMASPANPLRKLLATKKVVVLDGAMGTELERRGHDIRHELWSGKVLRDDPHEIQRVHEAYLAAGADVILTASYQIGDDPHLLKRAASVAKAASQTCSRLVAIGGSLGPYGACLADGSEYTGSYEVSLKDLVTFYKARITPLLSAQVDFIAFETVPSLFEAKAISLAIAETEWGTACAWISFTCKDASTVVSGDAFSACIEAIKDIDNVFAVGVNCTAPKHILGLLATANRCTEKVCVVYPNRGASWCANTGWSSASQDTKMVDWMGEFIAAGARIVGGCCQTTPEDIRDIVSRLK